MITEEAAKRERLVRLWKRGLIDTAQMERELESPAARLRNGRPLLGDYQEETS